MHAIVDLEEWRAGCKIQEVAAHIRVLLENIEYLNTEDDVFYRLHTPGIDKELPLTTLSIVSGFRAMSENLAGQITVEDSDAEDDEDNAAGFGFEDLNDTQWTDDEANSDSEFEELVALPRDEEDDVPIGRKVSFLIGHTDNDDGDFSKPPPERRRSANFASRMSMFGN